MGAVAADCSVGDNLNQRIVGLGEPCARQVNKSCSLSLPLEVGLGPSTMRAEAPTSLASVESERVEWAHQDGELVEFG